MPLYPFIHEQTNEVHDVTFSMNDTKIYNGPDGTQIGQWKRLWGYAPGAAVDTQIDPHSPKDFVKVTNKRGGTVGELWDRAEEMSQRRAEKNGGYDPVKQKYYDQFQKSHAGTKHPQQVKEEGVAKLKKLGIDLDWGDRL